MTTPQLHIQTCFVLDFDARIVATREPKGVRGPLLSLVRGSTSCAWAIRSDVPAAAAEELDRLAREEPPVRNLRDPPIHAQRYLSVLSRTTQTRLTISEGIAFAFPDALATDDDVVVVTNEAMLDSHFQGWEPGEIDAGRGPVLAVVEDGSPVSICFCARRSSAAAEAGLDTAEAYRRKGFGARVTAAWAAAIRASGLTPLYSTAWNNEASLGVARKLQLVRYAYSWNVSG